MDKPISKDTLLKQADAFRDLARRSLRLAESVTQESDRKRLQRHAQELEDSASGLEKQAIDAKTGVFASPLPRSA
jgi:hypothetical protein